ncbi:MAG: alpha-galactosidase [Opitutaceae bacterium]|jgi:alpha-galactosidase|nr:alpha-galactosidase [Opitutaceae bacterium]
MPILLQARHQFADTVVRYQAPHDNPGAWGLSLVPASMEEKLSAPREWLDTPAVLSLPAAFQPIRAWEVAPLVALHRRGDALPPAFANGRTLLTSPSAQTLSVREQVVLCENDGARRVTTLRTTLAAPDKLVCVHDFAHRDGDLAFRVRVTLRNDGSAPVTLDFATSFNLGGITPFAPDDAPGRLHLHRFRSAWSAEARHEKRAVEELHLERSWTGHGVRVERFGQTGSMPVNGWFSFAAVEDAAAGVVWAAQLDAPGSWQMELLRRADQFILAGGLADRLSGEWSVTLRPGEALELPAASLAVVAGTLDDACDRLTALQRAGADETPAPAPAERALPVIFNEWCSSWGAPTHQNLTALASTLAAQTGDAVRYLVIDDGWADRPSRGFQQNGDWLVNRSAFPDGLRATADAIRAYGFVPGIWFEFEAVNPGSCAWHETAHQLHRDGAPLQVGNRRFWDFRDPWVHDFLAERVIALLRENGFGYLKVDHNDTLGPGVDGPESPGENLRRHLACVRHFFSKLRTEVPGLVIETCASGGHRLEPSWLALSALGSSSDAHETPDIPIIAANLHRLILPAQSQIWAVLRAADSRQRLAWSLAATFLGRMCLSGDARQFDDGCWGFIREALATYHAAVPLIRDGRWRARRECTASWQHPQGWQIATACDEAMKNLLVVWHRFSGIQQAVRHPFPSPGAWRLAREFSEHPAITLAAEAFTLAETREWTGGVALLTREK